MPTIKAFFIRGRNKLFQISSGAYATYALRLHWTRHYNKYIFMVQHLCCVEVVNYVFIDFAVSNLKIFEICITEIFDDNI